MNITRKVLESGHAVMYQRLSSPGTTHKRAISLAVADRWLEVGEATEMTHHNWAITSTWFQFMVRCVGLIDCITLLVEEHHRRTSWEAEKFLDDRGWYALGLAGIPNRFPTLDQAGNYLERAYPGLCKLAKNGDAPQVRVRNVIEAPNLPEFRQATFKGGFPIIHLDEG